MMATTSITGSETQTKKFDGSLCSQVWASEFKQQSISFSAVHILLSITATIGNSLILVALHKVSSNSLHPSSKLLYRCLATTDLLVGLVTHVDFLAAYFQFNFEEKFGLIFTFFVWHNRQLGWWSLYVIVIHKIKFDWSLLGGCY